MPGNRNSAGQYQRSPSLASPVHEFPPTLSYEKPKPNVLFWFGTVMRGFYRSYPLGKRSAPNQVTIGDECSGLATGNSVKAHCD